MPQAVQSVKRKVLGSVEDFYSHGARARVLLWQTRILQTKKSNKKTKEAKKKKRMKEEDHKQSRKMRFV